MLCWGWGQDLGSVFGTWGRDLGLGTTPHTRSGGFRGCLGPRGQRLGRGDSVLGWSLGTSHGLDPNLVPRVGTMPPKRGQERGWGTTPGAGTNLRAGDFGSRGGQHPGAGAHFGDSGGIYGDGCFGGGTQTGHVLLLWHQTISPARLLVPGRR